MCVFKNGYSFTWWSYNGCSHMGHYTIKFDSNIFLIIHIYVNKMYNVDLDNIRNNSTCAHVFIETLYWLCVYVRGCINRPSKICFPCVWLHEWTVNVSSCVIATGPRPFVLHARKLISIHLRVHSPAQHFKCVTVRCYNYLPWRLNAFMSNFSELKCWTMVKNNISFYRSLFATWKVQAWVSCYACKLTFFSFAVVVVVVVVIVVVVVVVVVVFNETTSFGTG